MRIPFYICSIRDCGYPVGNNVSLLYTYLLFISLAINPQWMYDYFPTADSQFVSVTIVSFWFVSLFIYLLIIFSFIFRKCFFRLRKFAVATLICSLNNRHFTIIKLTTDQQYFLGRLTIPPFYGHPNSMPYFINNWAPPSTHNIWELNILS